MRTYVIVAILACVSCSNAAPKSATSDRATAKVLNPISAPSASVNPEIGQVTEQAAPVGAPADAPRLLVFTDAKFSIVVPSADWQLQSTPQGVFIVNEKDSGLVGLRLSEDARPLKVIAEEEQARMKAEGQHAVSDVQTLDEPEVAMFVIASSGSDGPKIAGVLVFLRNPGNPKEVITALGAWMDGKTAVRDQVMSIISSVRPHPQ